MKRLIKKTMVGAVLLLGAMEMNGQAWNTVGSGLPTNNPTDSIYTVKTVESNGELYVAYNFTDIFFSESTISLRKWNGLTWTHLADTTNSTGFNLGDLAVFQGQVYVGINGGLIKFSGGKWLREFTFTGSFEYISSLEIYTNELVIGGNFTETLGGQSYTNIVRYDGTNYSSMGSLPTFVGDILNTGSSLYSASDSVRIWNGSAWANAAKYKKGVSSISFPSLILEENNGQLFALDYARRTLLEISSDTLNFIGNLPFQPLDIQGYQNEIYVTGRLGVGNQLGGGKTFKYDGQNLAQVIAPINLVGLHSFQGELYAFSAIDIFYNGIRYNRAFRTSSNFSSILNGTVYIDANADCFFNTGEEPLRNGAVILSGNVISTDTNGHYSVGVAAGTYSVDSVFSMESLGKNFTVNCSFPAQIMVGNGQTVTQDFGISNNVPVDVQTYLTASIGWRARFGFTENYQLDFNNAGNATLPTGSVNLTLPQGAGFVSSTPSPASQGGNVLTYDFLNTQPAASRQVNLQVKIDTAAFNLGDTIKFYANISGVNGDADLADNADTLCQTVTGAFDPNDKQASAATILPGTKRIDYHIRFQNTGTDTAYKVTVVDTLDMTLPVTQIIINSASHPYNLSVVNNILVWEFDNINLLDSGADYLGSQGFVRFSAGIDASLGVGDTIDNDAEIYFDFQNPVHTNHAKTAIVSPVSVAEISLEERFLQVFPNPASEFLILKNRSENVLQAELTDLQGRKIQMIELQGFAEKRLNINELPTGIYILRSGKESSKSVSNRISL